MKAFSAFCSLLFLFQQHLPAQIFDRSLSFGFRTTQQVVKPLGNGQWLAVGIGLAYQEGRSSDTLFAVIFDQQGQVLWQKTLISPSGETYTIAQVLPLADGGFLVSLELGSCDTGTGYAGVVQKYAQNGLLVWKLQGEINEGTKPPPVWKVAPDGNLLGLHHNKMWKVAAATGSVIGQAALIGADNRDLLYFDLLPGTEDFLGIGSLDYFPEGAPPDFEVWRKFSSSTETFYLLDNSLELPGSRHGLGFAPNGWYYAIHDSAHQLERINPALENEVLHHSVDLNGFVEMAATDDGLYFLGRQNGQNWLRKTDFLGQNPVELPMPGKWLSGHALAVQGNAAAVVGTDGSGPKSSPGEPDAYPEFQALQLWMRTFSGWFPTFSQDTTNAAITDLQQLSTVDTLSHPGTWRNYYSMEGGDFKVQITNRGNTVLEQVYVNFSYEKNQNFICFFTPTAQRLYTDLHLAPGQSTWLTFGDLNERQAGSVPHEFCFWTSAPNAQPDAHHEDDAFCKTATYTINLPSIEPIQLLPNPAKEYFRVIHLTNPAEAEWQLYDAIGRLIQHGVQPANQPELTVSTQLLPNGFYIFRINGYTGKVVVRH